MKQGVIYLLLKDSVANDIINVIVCL